MQKLKRICVLLISAILILGCSFSSYANIDRLMFATDSNAALMTLDLFDDDYGISTFSTLGTVTNTIDPNARVRYSVFWYDDEGKLSEYFYDARYVDGRWVFDCRVDGIISQMNIFLDSRYGALPQVGTYDFSFDLASTFGYDYSSVALRGRDTSSNVANNELTSVLSDSDWEQFSGDLYISPITLRLGSIDAFWVRCAIPTSQNLTQLGGSFSFRFAQNDDEPEYSLGVDNSSGDYQSGVSSSLSNVNSSLSNISSSMDRNAESIEEVADAIDALRGAMEPHYDNVLTQLHHITEQLHAFYDQVYNNIHLPQFNLLGQIKSAIENLDVNITVDVDGLKSTITKVSADIQTKQEAVKSSINNKLDNVKTGVTNKLQTVEDNLESTMDENTDQIDTAIEEHGNFMIEGLKSLFIPSDEYFKAYFDDLFGWFSDRFGFLSFPIDLLSRVVDLYVNSSNVDCVLTLPSFEISGENLLSEHSFNLTDFLESNFAFILSALRMVTSIGLIMAFVNLCGDKWNEVMMN